MRKTYITNITQGLNGKYASEIENVWLKIELFERKINCRLEDGFSKEQYIQLFEYQSVASTNSFYVRKSGIASYLKWLITKGYIEDTSLRTLQAVSFKDIRPDNIFESRYYKDFQDLYSEIYNTICFANRHDNAVFDLQISALYLAWCGFSIEEAIQLKKKDISDSYIMKGDERITPNATIMNHLIKYRDAISYEQKGRGIIVRKYLPSEFFLRTTSSHKIESPRVLRVFINQFGISGNDSNPFNYDKILKSGIFNRVFSFESNHFSLSTSNVDIMETLFQEKYVSREAAYKRLMEYQKYRDYFYSSLLI